MGPSYARGEPLIGERARAGVSCDLPVDDGALAVHVKLPLECIVEKLQHSCSFEIICDFKTRVLYANPPRT